MQKTVNSRNPGSILFSPLVGPLSGATTPARVNLGAMVMKEYSIFPKGPALLEPHPQIV